MSHSTGKSPLHSTPGANRRQAGAAILVALLVVALAAMAASGFMFHSQVEWRRLDNLVKLDQARSVLHTAEQWGAAVLQEDARHSSVDYPGEAWASRLPPVEAEGYQVSGQIEDQDGRFNLNNLVQSGKVDERQLAIFGRLLGNLRLPVALAATLADWLDLDDVPINENSAENAYYLRLTPPYHAANRPLISVNELLRVKGYDRDVVVRLRPFVTALPAWTPVNLNTASPEVIAALMESLSLDDAYALVARRARAYYRNVQDFQQALPSGLSVAEDLVTVSSHFFLVQARIRRERLSLGEQALYQRAGTEYPTLIWRAEL